LIPLRPIGSHQAASKMTKRISVCFLAAFLAVGLVSAKFYARTSAEQPPAQGAAPAPHLDSIEPSQAAPGADITIHGTNFGSSKGSVRIGTAAAKITSWSETKVVVKLPADAVTGIVTVCQLSRCSNGVPLTLDTTSVSDNGVFVDAPRMYDDAALQQLLNAARAQLSSMRALDQAGVASRIGVLQGASVQQSSFGLQVGGPPLPGVSTVANTGNTVASQSAGGNTQQNSGSTNTTQGSSNNQTTTGTTNTSGSTTSAGNTNTSTTANTNQLQVTGPSTNTTSTGNNQTQVTGPSTVTTTTQAPLNYTPVAPPTSTPFSLPSTFSPSASDVLNEQMQLTYEIAGYQLLLEGSLSDRYLQVPIAAQIAQLIRPRATFGIPISINSSKKYQKAVAEVVIDVTSSSDSYVNEAPKITALLPREKTYNVAAITSSMVSLGGGVVTQVVSAGVSGLWGHQTYYVVQDQDTLAFQLPPDTAKPATTRFGWQFRPVLGRESVRSGMRQVFVQLAFPVPPTAASFGQVRVTTAWHKFDRKKGIVDRDPIKGSVSTYTQPLALQNFNLEPFAQNTPAIEDGGNGSLTVLVLGNYLNGTAVRVGSTTLLPGIGNVVVDPAGIRFTAPALQLATQKAYLVDRSGVESEIVNPLFGPSEGEPCISIQQVQPAFPSVTNVLVTIKLAFKNDSACGQNQGKTGYDATDPQLVAVLGGRVFGFRDSPFQSRSADTLSFLVPADALRAAPRVTVVKLLSGPRFVASKDVTVKPPVSIDKAVPISQTESELDIALIGSGLTGLTPVAPAGAQLVENTDTGAILKVPAKAAKGLKQLVLRGSSGELLLIAMPDNQATPPQLQPSSGVKVGKATTITVQGSGLEGLVRVEYNAQKLKTTLSDDKKSVKIELPQSVVAKPGTQELLFVFKSHNIPYPVSVFDNKIETSQPPSPLPSTPPSPSTPK
jgi:hypothetical protein